MTGSLLSHLGKLHGTTTEPFKNQCDRGIALSSLSLMTLSFVFREDDNGNGKPDDI